MAAPPHAPRPAIPPAPALTPALKPALTSALTSRTHPLRRAGSLTIGTTLVIAALALVAGQAGLFGGQPPAQTGPRDGRLPPPAATPNNVHSQAEAWGAGFAAAKIAPLPLRGDGPSTMARLATLLAATPGARIVESRPDYLGVQFTTRWMKFVDDAEFWFDPAAGVVQVRSASRLGRSDWGVNRARIEALRAGLAAGP